MFLSFVAQISSNEALEEFKIKTEQSTATTKNCKSNE